MNINDFVDDYLRTALWAETVILPCDESEIVDGCMNVDDDHPLYNVHESEPLDDYFATDDFDNASVAAAREDCERFIDLIDEAGLLERAEELGDIAYNFWLTRNGHGAGFWDGDFAEIGDKLTEIVKDNFGECTILASENGSLYLHC